MKMKILTSLIGLVLLQGCTPMYNVSKDVKLKTISGTKTSAQTGRTIIEVKDINRANINSIYSSPQDIYTIQKIDKGKMFVLYGVTKNIKELNKNQNTLIQKYNLNRLSLSKKNQHSSDTLVDKQKLYLTISKKDDNFVYEYTNDMNVNGAKRIRIERRKAEKERVLKAKRAEEQRISEIKKAEKKKQERIERRRLAKQKAEEKKQIEQKQIEQRKILLQQEKEKELRRLNLLKRSIGKKVSWYGSHKVDTDDCVQLYFFRKCMWVTYKYKYTGILKDVDVSSYTIQVTGVQLSIPRMVSMKYKQYQNEGTSWGKGQVGSVKKVNTSHDVNIL